MKKRRWTAAGLAAMAAALGCAVVFALAVTSPNAGGGPAAGEPGPTSAVAAMIVETLSPAPGEPSMRPSATATPSPRPTVAPASASAETSTPIVLAATAAPAAPVISEAAGPSPISCPAYPILLEPEAGLLQATEGAMGMWERYLGCPAFEISGGGLGVRYAADWPGACRDPDIAACTMNGVFLSPLAPLYNAESVIAHELGHILNVEHGEGPGVMDPGLWDGPGTVWCEVDAMCTD